MVRGLGDFFQTPTRQKTCPRSYPETASRVRVIPLTFRQTENRIAHVGVDSFFVHLTQDRRFCNPCSHHALAVHPGLRCLSAPHLILIFYFARRSMTIASLLYYFVLYTWMYTSSPCTKNVRTTQPTWVSSRSVQQSSPCLLLFFWGPDRIKVRDRWVALPVVMEH